VWPPDRRLRYDERRGSRQRRPGDGGLPPGKRGGIDRNARNHGPVGQDPLDASGARNRLSRGDHVPTANISIRFDRVRADGLVVAILAGLILYGTAAFGFARLRS